MNIFTILFLQNFNKIFSKTHQIAPFFFNLLGGAYPRTPLACNTIHNHANTPTFPKYFEPSPPEIKSYIDMPLKKGLG